MNEIPELRGDLAFLKKFDSRSKTWREFGNLERKGKVKVLSNFLLHPKRLSSDSECSSGLNSPRLTNTELKRLNLNEQNNNIQNEIHNCSNHPGARINNVEQNMQSRIHNNSSHPANIINKDENYFIETGIGDCADHKKVSRKTVSLSTKKSSKLRPSTSFVTCFDKKFKTLVERSLQIISNIKERLEEGISRPDGEEDFARRTKRLQEFTSRFSRVYLYPLLRQTDELSMPEKIGLTTINQKFIYAQHLVLQALQAYYAHLPSSIGKCGSDKLKSLLEQTHYMCHLYELLKRDTENENFEFINVLRAQTEDLLQTVNQFELKFVEKKPKDVKSNVKPQKSKIPHANKNKSKLSMYLVTASFRGDLNHKGSGDYLGKKKFAVKSRYKTAGFKHRPPIEKKIENVADQKNIFVKDSQVTASPILNPIREEDIKTMIELNASLDTPPNTGVNLNHENSIASSRRQLVQDTDRGTNINFEENNVEKALDVLRKFFGNSAENKQTDFLEKIAHEVDKRKDEIGNSPVKTDKSKKKFKEPIITVTGAKNAKLICIRDDNSVADDDEISRKDKEIMTDVEVKLSSSPTPKNLKKNEKRNRSKSVVKISRLPKTNKKTLNLLSKEYAINIIQYKLRYNHFHKNNPMYRKSAHIQPWILMGRISDDLLDHLLQSITEELEVNEILENLFNSEFQY